MNLNAPAFGQYWTGQGGILVATIPAMLDMPTRHIIAAVETKQLTWGGYGDDVSAATSRIDGARNTRALLEDAKAHPAAKFCGAYEADGHKDFFLGSQLEHFMALLMSPETFEKQICWTSTQASRSCAFVQDFASGDSGWYGKDGKWRVRPFRQIHVNA